jgi:hypothetical protein
MVQEIKEDDLYPIITSSERFRDHVFYRQVPTADWTEGRKRIDLVTLESGKVVAIELKVSKWKDAFRQAFRNLFASDFSYVALWHRHMRAPSSSLFTDWGIGLIELDGTAKIAIEAANSRFVIPKKRDYLLAQCNAERICQ